MLIRNQWILALLLTALCKEMHAQYDPSFSHYWAVEPSFNPAAVGKENKINVAAVYNMSMVGFEHNPRTMFVSADMPFSALGSTHGVGATILNDQIGLFSHKKFAIQYAYQRKLLGGTLSVGLQAGMLSENLNGSKLDLADAGDAAFSTSDVTGSAVDLGAGVYFRHRYWYVGASMQHLTSPTVEIGQTNELNIAGTYYLTAGGNIRMRNPFLTIHPTLLARFDGVGYRADLSGRLVYKHEEKLMWAGLGVSPTNSVTVMLGGLFHGVRFGYSYEIYTSAISIGNGSHELFIGYQTDMSLFKKGRNMHQSVRFL